VCSDDRQRRDEINGKAAADLSLLAPGANISRSVPRTRNAFPLGSPAPCYLAGTRHELTSMTAAQGVPRGEPEGRLLVDDFSVWGRQSWLFVRIYRRGEVL
jgi:hypothetical protein